MKILIPLTNPHNIFKGLGVDSSIIKKRPYIITVVRMNPVTKTSPAAINPSKPLSEN